MKHYPLLIALIGLFIFQACSDSKSWKTLDPSTFNQEIKGDDSIKDAAELIYQYYFSHPDEDIPTFDITTNKKSSNEWVVTLVVDGLLDDSVKGEQVVMVAKKDKNQWKVLSIKKNWKCYAGRGHEDWGIELCQ